MASSIIVNNSTSEKLSTYYTAYLLKGHVYLHQIINCMLDAILVLGCDVIVTIQGRFEIGNVKNTVGN